MSARNEHQIEIEEKILRLINGQPEILRSYYYSMSDKTAETKLKYVFHIISFFKYLNSNNINPYNIDELCNIKKTFINRYLDYSKYNEEKTKELTSGYQIIILSSLRNFFDVLVDDGYINTNPCSKIKIKKAFEEKDIVAITKQEYKKMENNIRRTSREEYVTRDLLIFNLGCTTGMRLQEIIDINIEDINIDEKTIKSTGKGNITRYIYLSEKTIDYLNNYMKDRSVILTKKNNENENALFITNRGGKRMSKDVPRDLLKRISFNIDKHITPHKMRSTCATTLYNKTGDIFLAQETLGHRNVQTTKRYAKMSKERRKTAADILGGAF